MDLTWERRHGHVGIFGFEVIQLFADVELIEVRRGIYGCFMQRHKNGLSNM